VRKISFPKRIASVPQLGGAVSVPLARGRPKWRDNYPEGSNHSANLNHLNAFGIDGATRPLPRDGEVWRNSKKTQQSGHALRSGPEVKNGSSAKDGALERLGCVTIQEEVSQILQRVSCIGRLRATREEAERSQISLKKFDWRNAGAV